MTEVAVDTGVVVHRGQLAWSRWQAAKLMIELNLERAGLEGPYAWIGSDSEMHYLAPRATSEFVAEALKGLGLTIEVAD
jgi:hypothetical protein